MPFVDDTAKVRRILWVLAIELGDCHGNTFGQRFSHIRRGKHIVRRHAGLPGIGEFAPHNAACSHVDVRSTIHKTWRLAAKFQSDRRQVLDRRPHHDFADAPATGIEDMVERILQQITGFLRSAFNHTHRLGIEVLRHEFSKQFGCIR